MSFFNCLYDQKENYEELKPCLDVNVKSTYEHFFEILLHSKIQLRPNHKDLHSFDLVSAVTYIVKSIDPFECDER